VDQVFHDAIWRIGEVTAGEVQAALEHVSAQLAEPFHLPIIRSPAELVDHRPEPDGGVGETSADHDVSSAFEGLDDGLGADICVGGRDLALHVLDSLAKRRYE